MEVQTFLLLMDFHYTASGQELNREKTYSVADWKREQFRTMDAVYDAQIGGLWMRLMATSRPVPQQLVAMIRRLISRALFDVLMQIPLLCLPYYLIWAEGGWLC